MKKLLALLLCVTGLTLYAENYLDYVDRAEKYLEQRYKSGSIARDAGMRDLIRIISSEKSDSE